MDQGVPCGAPTRIWGQRMRYKTLDDLGDLGGKRLLVRVDFNVPMAGGSVADDSRLRAALPTVRELADRGAIVLLLSHLGRPQGRRMPEFSLAPVVPAFAALLGRPVRFIEDCIGEAARAGSLAMRAGEVAILENARFHPGEEENDSAFAAALAGLADIYVNDAFSAAHRAHASTEGVAHLLPAYAGRAMAAELAALERALHEPARPLTAIVGGAKVSTKLATLRNLVTKVNYLLLGGAMANTFLAAKGLGVGRSRVERELEPEALEILKAADQAGCTVHLPYDVIVARTLEPNPPSLRTARPGAVAEDEMILDLGPVAGGLIDQILAISRTVVWNGPLGAFETPPFERRTLALARALAAMTRAGTLMSVAGGGDTVAAINRVGAAADLSHVSTAGGAFLEWLEGKRLPGVRVIEAG